MCNCTVDSAAGTGAFSLVLEILHLCGHAHVQSYVSQGMGYIKCSEIMGNACIPTYSHKELLYFH